MSEVGSALVLRSLPSLSIYYESIAVNQGTANAIDRQISRSDERKHDNPAVTLTVEFFIEYSVVKNATR